MKASWFTVQLGASEAWQFKSQRSWGKYDRCHLPARRKSESKPGPSVLISLSITKNLTGQKPFWSTRMDAELMSFWSRSVGISLSRISNAWPFSAATSFSVQRGDLVTFRAAPVNVQVPKHDRNLSPHICSEAGLNPYRAEFLVEHALSGRLKARSRKRCL